MAKGTQQRVPMLCSVEIAGGTLAWGVAQPTQGSSQQDLSEGLGMFGKNRQTRSYLHKFCPIAVS